MTRFYKLTIFSFLCLISTIGISQIKLDLQWEKQQLIENGDTLVVPNCSYCLLDKNNKPNIIYSISEKVDSIWIDNIESEFLLGHNTTGYPTLNLTTETILSGKQTITNIYLPAYYTEKGKLKKIKSVSINYQSSNDTKNQLLKRNKKSSNYATSSKLKTGRWFKLEVNKDGVYKLNASYLSSLGIDLGSINANKLKIYGSGNAVLPQQNNLPRHDDLVENAIYVSSTTSFGANDYILFYGQSPHKIVIDETNKLLSHEKNIYTESSYYFLTTDGDDGLRIGTQNNIGIPTKTITTSDEYVFEETDKHNALQSGRSWYAHVFDTQKTYSFDIATPDKVNGSDFRYQSGVMAQAYSSQVTFSTTLNGVGVGSQNISKNAVSSHAYGITGYNKTTNFNLNFASLGNSNSFTAQISFVGDANSTRSDGLQTHGFFDYAGIQYKRNLATSTSQVIFRNFESLDQNFTKYQLGLPSGYTVWNITAPLSPQKVMLSGGQSFIENSTVLNQYVLFANSNFLTPLSTQNVANQNLHGITNIPNLVIVSYEPLKAWAQIYADYRNEKGLSYLIVTPQQIYNEFSSGAQDISAIRDFLKMLYDKDPNTLQYTTLFGGASYDYKNRIENNTNQVPIYESIESLHNVQTFSSDDYYGFLADGDGTWTENNTGNHQMVISVGRLLARNDTEAEALITKIKRYENSPNAYGDWRTYVSLLADDGDGNLHVKDADKLSKIIDQKVPATKINKIYLDNHEQFIQENGWGISPGFNDEYKRSIDKGALIVNFTGHGSPAQLATEAMLTLPLVSTMTNYNKLPIYVTATCDVGKYDNPETKTIIMNLLYNEKGGAIATVSTTRPVYASSNFIINKAFYQNVFQRNADSTYRTLGEAFMHTKNASTSGVNNRNFSLLGDPCLKLSLPDNKLILTEINQSPVTTDADTLKALAKVVLKGKVTDGLENAITNFNGKLTVKIYDKAIAKKTLGSVDAPFSYQERSNSLFDGTVTVNNGLFEITFVVPKDISYEYALGRIKMYASNNELTSDAVGYYSNVVIGGSNSSATPNEDAPSASLFMDDETFINGGNTRETTLFIADLFDENGINTTNTGIGHEISLIIDHDTENTIILNSFYKAELDEYKYGRVEYKLKGIKQGRHHLKFTAWDTHNNPVIEELEFVVGDNVAFYTYPNPFIDETTLYIDHNNGEAVNVHVSISNYKGQLLLAEDYEYIEDSSIINNITWDGTFNENKVQSGVYFIKIDLYYPSSQKTISKIHKAVLLH